MTLLRLPIVITTVLLLAAMLSPARAREKTDEIVLANGDLIHGEIKELTLGRVKYSTDAADTIYIKWEDIVSITSDYYYEVELTDGTRYFGSLGAPDHEGVLVVILGEQSVDLVKAEVVEIAPIKSTFLARVDGSLNLGFNFTKSSGVATLNVGATATHRAREFMNDLFFSSNVTVQTDREDSTRGDLNYTHVRFLENRYLWGAGAALQRNDELGIDLRILLQGGVGRAFVQTNHNRLVANTGLAVNKEWNTSGPSDVNLEAFFSGSYRYYQYRTPKADILVKLDLFPGLTDWGRIRAEFSMNFRREMVKDFFWNLEPFYSFDNRPRTVEASNDDWGIVTSVSWTF